MKSKSKPQLNSVREHLSSHTDASRTTLSGSNGDLIGDRSRKYLLPRCKSRKHPDLACISPETVSDFFSRWHCWSRCCRWSMSFAVRIRPRSNSCTLSIVVIRMNTKVDTLIEQRISTREVKCSRNTSLKHFRLVIQRRDWSLSSTVNSLLNVLRPSSDTFVRKIERSISACILNSITPKCISSKEDTKPSSNIQENSAYLNSIARWSMATSKMLIKSIDLIRNKTRNSPADDDVSEYRTFVLACRSPLNQQQRARPIVLRIFATIFVTRALLLQINPEFFLLLLLHHIDEWH